MTFAVVRALKTNCLSIYLEEAIKIAEYKRQETGKSRSGRPVVLHDYYYHDLLKAYSPVLHRVTSGL